MIRIRTQLNSAREEKLWEQLLSEEGGTPSSALSRLLTLYEIKSSGMLPSYPIHHESSANQEQNISSSWSFPE